MSKGKENNNREDKSKDFRDKPKHRKRNRSESKGSKRTVDTSNILEVDTRPNNPNWYFTDKMLAEQVSQLSFQQLAGYDVELPLNFNGPGGSQYEPNLPVGNICMLYLNPSAGVTYSGAGGSGQITGLNLAGFRLFSKLSAYTGRTATYGPQDISTMILAMGSLIEQIECVRRAFGVAFTMNMRNRSYPKQILAAMGLDADDFLEHFADYRMMFNTLITRVNQLPIPQSIAYFDKCASIYERIYLDMNSAMAQTIIPLPATVWQMDESGYAGGTVLRTTDWCMDHTGLVTLKPTQTVRQWMMICNNTIDALMNSSTLQVVYTDLLNLAVKTGVSFWKMDYLSEGYTVFPEFNEHFMLQFHNMTFTAMPCKFGAETDLPNVTPYNDVYPDTGNNKLIYNPMFSAWNDASYPNYGSAYFPRMAILDLPTDNPTVEDRVEMTRYVSLSGMFCTLQGNTDPSGWYNCALPDHYGVMFTWLSSNSNLASPLMTSSFHINTPLIDQIVTYHSQLDWAPRLYVVDAQDGTYRYSGMGDLNFYTTIDYTYARRVHDFVSLALYDLR